MRTAEYISYSWRRTFGFMGGWPWLIGLLSSLVFGTALDVQLRGLSEAMGELYISAVYGLFAFVLLAGSVFLFNFLCAPYEIAETGRLKLEAELETLRPKELLNRLSTQKKFAIWEAACLLAGTPLSRNLSGGAASHAHHMKSYMADKEFQAPFAYTGHRIGVDPNILAIKIRAISDDQEIDRNFLVEYANMHRIDIEGITNEIP